jgi:hypothetical protein
MGTKPKSLNIRAPLKAVAASIAAVERERIERIFLTFGLWIIVLVLKLKAGSRAPIDPNTKTLKTPIQAWTYGSYFYQIIYSEREDPRGMPIGLLSLDSRIVFGS